MKYVTRKGGATVTVFVPYDCENKCPFCINKAEYSDTSRFDIHEIIRSIKVMDALTPECDFVFTGGEPLANLEMLQMMLDVIPNTHKVFINTTLPTSKHTEREIADFLNANYTQKKITGINVSRHLNKYVQECDDKIFSMLIFEPRINCVLYLRDVLRKPDVIRKFVDRFKNVTSHIQFRKDYVTTTKDNLYDEENDEILALLKKTFDYVGPFGQYRMRCGYDFNYNGYRVTYHKTLPYSKIVIDEEKSVLYDIIIKQDGTIKEDWDVCTNVTQKNRVSDTLANKLDLSAYKEVAFEEYK